MDPFSAGMFASIGSAFKFADVAVRIAEVGSENAVFVRAIRVVRSDLEEVERLLSVASVQRRLTVTPGKLPWVKGALHNTKCALNDIGKWVERARVEHETTGSIRFETRVRWVFNDHEKLVNRQAELSTCHQQLSNVLGYLMCLEDVPSDSVPVEELGNVAYFDEILSRHRKPSGPKASTELGTVRDEYGISGLAATRTAFTPLSRPTSVPGAWSPPTPRATITSDRRTSEPPPSLPSITLPPSSPPPTYALAVSKGPVLYSNRSETYPLNTTHQRTALRHSVDNKVPSSECNSHWAYRTDFDDVTVSELAGDTVVLSGTNSAGPVNPYEFCLNPTVATPALYGHSRAPSDDLAEALNDLSFPVELPDNSLPAQSQATARPADWTQSRQTTASRRATSEMAGMPYRQTVPENALSDSLRTKHELPTSLSIQRPPPRPAPTPTILDRTPNLTKAHSNNTWAVDTQPRALKEPDTGAQGSGVATRMQSQKRMMDLLGSIGG